MIPRWRARKNAVALGYRPSVIQLNIDPADHAALTQRCRAEWAKMEAWLANERPAPVFDGTLASLIDRYSRDEERDPRRNAVQGYAATPNDHHIRTGRRIH
jgi:hypothetical protein